jgi:hypothetical protein
VNVDFNLQLTVISTIHGNYNFIASGPHYRTQVARRSQNQLIVDIFSLEVVKSAQYSCKVDTFMFEN